MLDAIYEPYFFIFTLVNLIPSTLKVSVSISIQCELHVCIFLHGKIQDEQLEHKQKGT